MAFGKRSARELDASIADGGLKGWGDELVALVVVTHNHYTDADDAERHNVQAISVYR